MKLSQLKPCAICGGPLRTAPSIQWYVIRVGRAFLNAGAVNRTLGLAQMLGGAMGVAEAMSPDAARAVVILEDEPGSGGWTDLHVCMDCYHGRLAPLAAADEAANDDRDKHL
jgi:hypothetical protein